MSIGRPQDSISEHIVYRHSSNGPNFFHGIVWTVHDTIPSCFGFDKFYIFWSILGQKRLTQWSTCHNLHTVLQIVQTRYWWLRWVCVCPPTWKSWYYFKNVQTRPCSMDCVRVMLEDSLWEHVILSTSYKWPWIFSTNFYGNFRAPWKLFEFSIIFPTFTDLKTKFTILKIIFPNFKSSWI